MRQGRKRWIVWMLVFLAAIIIGRGILRYLDYQWSTQNRGRSDTRAPCHYLSSTTLDHPGGEG